MPSEIILVVPTYNYLSAPIIKKLADLNREDTELVCLDFYQPRAEFGLLAEMAEFSRRTKIYPDKNNPNIFELRRLRQRLIDYLTDLNPKLIITFSDVTFFARCLKGTKFEALVTVIQPCLLSAQQPTLTKRGIYAAGTVLNTILGCPVYRVKHQWGELLEKASYCIWGKIEEQSREIAGEIYRCGSLFMDIPSQPVRRTPRNSVLVVVPDLPYYGQEQLKSIISGYRRLLEEYPDLTFEFKYHPRNDARLPLSNYSNYVDILELDINNEINYSIIISGYSNIAVTLRCIHSKIIIYDLGWYANSKIAYLDPGYFFMAKTGEDLMKIFRALYNDPDVKEDTNSYCDAYFQVSPKFYEWFGRYFDVYPHSGLLHNYRLSPLVEE